MISTRSERLTILASLLKLTIASSIKPEMVSLGEGIMIFTKTSRSIPKLRLYTFWRGSGR